MEAEMQCPDCGAPWPGFARREPCSECRLLPDDVEAAADFLDEIVEAER